MPPRKMLVGMENVRQARTPPVAVKKMNVMMRLCMMHMSMITGAEGEFPEGQED